MGAHVQRAVLTVAIPTYARPDLLERALNSVLDVPEELASHLEVVVSDNSSDDASERVFRTLTRDSTAAVRYHRNQPSVGMVGNFNRCIELASGGHLTILHDDDRFLPGGVAAVIDAVRTAPAPVMLFGARVETETGRVLRRQSHRRRTRLDPPDAVRRLVTHSSYVRFPAITVSGAAYDQVGGFDPRFAEACDLDMWIRLATRFGIQLEPATVVGYLVHGAAATESMFSEGTVETVARIFDEVERRGTLPPEELRHATAAWYRQFALGGAFRALRAGDRRLARERLGLLDHPAVRARGPSWRWSAVEAGLRLLTLGAGG